MKRSPVFTFQITREGIENRLGEIERKMDRLRSLYESYFMGMEKIPPDTLRREVNRMMLEMQQVPIGRASLRFRFQALTQKWVLHMTYWNRTMREIDRLCHAFIAVHLPTAQTFHGKSRLILSDGKIRNLLFSIIGSNKS